MLLIFRQKIMSKIILTTEEELEILIRKVLAEFASTLLSNHNRNIVSTNKPALTINEAADFLSLSKQTLYGKTSKREIPFYKVGKRLYFNQQELIDLIAKGRKPTIKELVEEYENDRRTKKKRN
jgi:excisionase family DNA binding protein